MATRAIQNINSAIAGANIPVPKPTATQRIDSAIAGAGAQRSEAISNAISQSSRQGKFDNPPPPSQEMSRAERQRVRTPSTDFRDAAYNAQIAAIDRALRDFETGLQTRTQRYGEDFTRGVRDLGFRPGEGFQAAPDILQFRDLAEGLAAVRRPQGAMARGADEGPMTAAERMGGQWDLEGEFNPFSSAARGTRTSRDDFAGRGMIRSSDFVRSFAEFQDRLNQQLGAMETGQGRFFEDALTNLSSQRSTAEERRQAAERDAMMRAAIQAAR
jgi:hypothetical protein